jgi:hypothetical protein
MITSARLREPSGNVRVKPGTAALEFIETRVPQGDGEDVAERRVPAGCPGPPLRGSRAVTATLSPPSDLHRQRDAVQWAAPPRAGERPAGHRHVEVGEHSEVHLRTPP